MEPSGGLRGSLGFQRDPCLILKNRTTFLLPRCRQACGIRVVVSEGRLREGGVVRDAA